MLRHKWFIILIALQILNFAGMALFEQQRRSIWNKEVAHAQRFVDTQMFVKETEANYNEVAAALKGLDARVSVLQSAAERNVDNATLIREIRERVVNLEAGLQKLQPGK
jgi:carotenoid cleavage dioxygenase-like enzyme